MKIKQFGLILFLVVALMLALVACGDTPKDDATTEPEATQPGEQTTEPEATEPEITYTVSFSDGVAAIEVKEGEAAEEPDEPSKIGYRFDGWYLGENAYDFETPVTADIALTAKWTALSYDITYVLDGGTNAADAPESYTIEDTVVLPTPTKDGFDFGGWYDEDGNLVASIPAGTTGDIELTATWTALPLVKIDMEGWGSTTDGDMAIHYAENNTINGFEYKKAVEAVDGYVVPFSQTMGGYGDYTLAEFMKNLHNFHYIKNEGDAHGDFFRVELDSTKTIYVKFSADEDYNVGAMFDWNTLITAEAFELSIDFRYGEGAQFPVSFYLRDFLAKKAAANGDGSRLSLVTLMPNGDLDIGVDAAGKTKRLGYKDGNNFITSSTILGNATPDVWHTLTFHFEVNKDNGEFYYVKIKLDGVSLTGDDFLTLYVKDLKFDAPAANSGTYTGPAANCLMPFGGGKDNATAINGKIADGVIEDFKCYYDFDNIKIIAVEAE